MLVLDYVVGYRVVARLVCALDEGIMDLDQQMRYEIAKKTCKKRKEQGLSIDFVARKLGVSKSQYHRYESGESSLTAEKIPLLAHTLNVSPLFFVTASIEEMFVYVPFHQKAQCMELMQQFLQIRKEEHQKWMVKQAKLLSEMLMKL